MSTGQTIELDYIIYNLVQWVKPCQFQGRHDFRQIRDIIGTGQWRPQDLVRGGVQKLITKFMQ